MNAIDLRKTLEGHVIRWCKGHYGTASLENVLRVYSGYDGGYALRNLTDILMSSLTITGQASPRIMKQFVDTYFYHAGYDAHKISSYHVGQDDKVSAKLIFTTLISVINCEVNVNEVFRSSDGKTNVTVPILLLPELLVIPINEKTI